MRRFLVLLMSLIPSLAFAQGGAVNGNAIIVLSSSGRPIGGATVTICASPGVGVPCTNTVTVYTDTTLVTPTTNPATSDGNGNVVRYAAPGVYSYTVTGSGVSIAGQPFTATVAGPGGGNVLSGSSNVFTGTTNTFNNQVLLGAGSPATPSLAFVGHGAQGMYYNTTSVDVVLTDGLVDTIGIRAGETMIPQTSGIGFYHQTASAFDAIGKDTGITRPSAGTVCIDTTAIGNCLGTIKAASLNVAGITNSAGVQLFTATPAAGSCPTAAAVGALCTTAAITLPVAYADTNYRLSCTVLTPTNVAIVETYTKSNATFTITIAALTAAAANFGSFDCLAVHN